MAWADEQHAEWDLELQRMRYGFPPVDATNGHNSARPPQHNGGGHAMDANVDMERANEFAGAHAQNATMTYSASCPSFTALYELSSDDDLIRDIQAGGNQQQRASGFMTGNMTTQAPHHQLQPHLHEHELTTALNGGSMASQFEVNDKSYDFLLQMQQEHLDASLRQYPHQQTHFQGAPAASGDHFALFNQPRRPLHASASFTSLSSMETEYRRQSGKDPSTC